MAEIESMGEFSNLLEITQTNTEMRTGTGTLARNSIIDSAPIISGYSYINPLGSGGFTDVYLYQQTNPARYCAVKVLKKVYLGKFEEQLFWQEANILALVSPHPNVVNIFDSSTAQDGRPYIVLEKCDSSFKQFLGTGGADLGFTLDMGVSIASALEYLNRSGYLHRDVKPSNIMLNAFSRPVLADFGVSAPINEVNKFKTSASVGWAAPEVLSGGSHGSVQSDIYSFGLTLYSVLAGVNPFQNEQDPRKVQRLMSSWRYQTLNRVDVPPTLQTILQRMLSSNPAGRPSTFFDIASALQQIQFEARIPVSRIEVANPNAVPNFGQGYAPNRSVVQVPGMRRM